MAAPMKIVITLNTALAGRTIVLNGQQFVDGVLTVIASDDDCAGLARYFASSYNCTIWRGMHNEDPPQLLDMDELVSGTADGTTATGVEAPDPAEPEEAPEQEDEGPSQRDQDLIAAINMVEDRWIDDVVPHPSVANVAEILGDSTVTKEDIVAAVERFNLADDSPDVEAPENEESEE